MFESGESVQLNYSIRVASGAGETRKKTMLDWDRRTTPKWRLIRRDQKGHAYSVKEVLKLLAPEKWMCQRLLPRSQELARPDTLSSRYGLDIFPPHTDFATIDVPPQYLVLVAPQPRAADTLIYDAGELVREFGIDYLQRCLYLLRGRTSRYCRLITHQDNKKVLRYNATVMAAQNAEAHAVADYIKTSMRATCRIDWTQHRMAILDNWSAMHGRDALDGTLGVGLYRFALWGSNDLDNRELFFEGPVVLATGQ
ncbi:MULTISPECIES: TauD/TfdA family dioxygenase [Ralstonia]|nr:hypothetical protein [Ralstonia pickettii]MBA9965488.1 hypothetical protein [Ralstonia pickettii]MBA9984316.1 hypothetical protein [Ralstonia pickettii]MBA9989685.1 hypothetical protein [Ralstonia pickettii]CAJ0731324.1 hypothetical protein R38712_04682 [Ralstonia pickettii]